MSSPTLVDRVRDLENALGKLMESFEALKNEQRQLREAMATHTHPYFTDEQNVGYYLKTTLNTNFPKTPK